MATTARPEETGTKVITSKVNKIPLRFSYAHVFEPTAMGDGPQKYSVSLIIPKSNTALVDAIKAAIEVAKEQGKTGKWQGKVPATLKLPLRDGDKERPEDATYADAYFMSATTKTKPNVVGPDKMPIVDPTEFYSGCYGHASLNFYPFNSNGSKGVACGLNNLQKTKDGEALGGRSSADDDFDEEAGDDLA